MGDRAQTYTLEGIIASLVVLAGIFFALQATTAAPQSAGVTNPHAEQQDQTIAQDVVTIADQEELVQAALFWGSDGFHCAPSGREYYPGRTDGSCSLSTTPPNDFGQLLERHLGAGYSYNVIVAYEDTTGDRKTQRMVYQGEPADGAVRAVTSAAVRNDHPLYEADGTQSAGRTIRDSDFYASSAVRGSEHLVFHVEVIVWRG